MMPHTSGVCSSLREQFQRKLFTPYCRVQHVDIGSRAGLSHAQLAVIRDTSRALSDAVDPNGVLYDVQRRSLVYTDWMTRKIQVPQRVFDAVREVFNEQEIMEVTTTVACYNMVSRLLVALDVGDMAAAPVPEVRASS